MESFSAYMLQEDFDMELNNLMVEFLIDLDVDMLAEDKQEKYHEIIELLGEEDEEIGEDPEVMEAKLRRIIKKSDKAARKKEYRKNKGKLKRQAKKDRKKSSFKKRAKKAKRMAKRGKTSTGKRQTSLG